MTLSVLQQIASGRISAEANRKLNLETPVSSSQELGSNSLLDQLRVGPSDSASIHLANKDIAVDAQRQFNGLFVNTPVSTPGVAYSETTAPLHVDTSDLIRLLNNQTTLLNSFAVQTETAETVTQVVEAVTTERAEANDTSGLQAIFRQARQANNTATSNEEVNVRAPSPVTLFNGQFTIPQ